MIRANYSKQEIIQSLKGLGLKVGDNVFVQSNLGGFGLLEGAKKKVDYYKTFKAAIFEVIGDDGTLINPAFSYSFCKGEDFDVENTPSTVGAFSELARLDAEAIRSHDPNFSIAAIGKNAVYFTEKPDHHSFGEQSYWKRFLDKNGVFLTFNLDNTFISFRHYLEKCFNVPYRYDKAFTGKVIDGETVTTETYYHYVRDLGNSDYIPNRKRYHNLITEMGFLNEIPLGKGKMQLISAKNAFNIGKIGVEKDPAFFIKADHVNFETKPMLNRYFDRLFPICRSLTGEGNRETLKILSELVDLAISEIPSGQQCFDWNIPPEWNIKQAWIKDSKGNVIVDFTKNNLHILGYSSPYKGKMHFNDLKDHLYTLPELPDAIPYLTSYYKERWGFCLSQEQYNTLDKNETYEIFIDSSLDSEGSMTTAEAVIKGSSDKEILISTYICHPSMGNNELSGPLVSAFIYKALKKRKALKYTYRFLFIPETIGSICYLSMNGERMKEKVEAGFVITCAGDGGKFTYKRSRKGNTLPDRAAEAILKQSEKEYNIHDFFPGGSDERQYCSPGFNLPVGSLMRSMYGKYPEYHTSKDNKDFISFEEMEKSILKYLDVLELIEKNKVYKNTMPYCEPQLGKRGLYPTLGSQKDTADFVNTMMWVLNFADGTNDVIDIINRSNKPSATVYQVIEKLLDKGLLIET